MRCYHTILVKTFFFMPEFEMLNEIDPDLNYFNAFENINRSNYYSIEQYHDLIQNSSTNLNLISYNIRSFHKNFDAFTPVIEKSPPHVLILTETWFTENNLYNIPNYQSFHTVRSNRHSGGVSVYVRGGMEAKEIKSCSYANDSIEVCTVEIVDGRDKFCVVAVYRPHCGTVLDFTSDIETILKNPNFKDHKYILAGDFNVRLDHESQENTIFVETLRSYYFLPVITKPTRFSSDDRIQPSLLDMIWINSPVSYNSGILMYDITDHCPTFLQFPMNFNQQNMNDKVKISFRLINDENKAKFTEILASFDWSTISSNDLNNYVSNFVRTLNDLYCDAFPLKTKFISKQKSMNPWFTAEIRELVHSKSTFFAMKRLGAITKEENNNFKNRVKFKIKQAKSLYYKNLFQRNINNMHATWKTLKFLMNGTTEPNVIRSLCYNGNVFSEDMDICEIFSDFFAKIPLELEAKLPEINADATENIFVPLDNLVEPSILSLSTPLEVSNIISNLKISKQDKNCIPIRLLIANRDILSTIISHILNLCMNAKFFPDFLKIAKIIPVFKKGDPTIPSHYRPISILPYLSKIYEKLIYFRLASYFSSNSLFTNHQFGFRKNMSTMDAIIFFTEVLYNALNNKESVINILIDFAKAFDSVNHRILIKKLIKYGVPLELVLVIESFLENRQQTVHYKKFHSQPKISNLGIPQGSILGPLLFIIFVNDLPSLSQIFIPTIFADDCTLQLTGSNLDELIITCNSELQNFKQWSDNNRLTINVQKTNSMLVSNIHPVLPDESIQLNEQLLNNVLETKFLGMVIDKNLKFDQHIGAISAKISKSIGILYRLRGEGVSPFCLRIIYFSIIHPHLLYCLPLFGATYDTHINPLKILQKRAIRILNNANYLDHTEPLFYASKILKIEDQYKLSIASYVYKNPNILTPFSRNHHYSTRNRSTFVPPFERLRSSQQSVLYNSVRIWNCVPEEIKTCQSFVGFKNRYKEYLLEFYNQ